MLTHMEPSFLVEIERTISTTTTITDLVDVRNVTHGAENEISMVMTSDGTSVLVVSHTHQAYVDK